MHETHRVMETGGPSANGVDYDELARREREQRFLASAGEALAGSLDYRATLNMVAHMAAGAIADFCVVELLGEDGRLERVASEDVEAGHCDELCETVESVQVDDGHWAVARALDEQRVVPVTVEELPSDEFGDALRRMGAHSVIVAPLRVRDRAIGVLVLGWRSATRVYGDAEASLAAELARRAAMAIDNARLYADAQRAILARDQTLAIVAHDLRNPLGLVSMTAALVKEIDEPGAAVVARMEIIERAAATMNRLIQDLLDAARIDAGKLEMKRAADDPAAILTGTAETMAPLAARAGLSLDVELEGDLPRVHADRGRLQQALGNLVGNAIKFTPAPGRVVLGARREGVGVRIFVSDTGPGIESEHLAHLFDRFWQKTPGDARGIGLGLAITKGIVEAHGARIAVRSEPGQGTEFSFVLDAAAE